MDKRTKWCYCVGACGRDAAYALVSMFLMLYVQYTVNLTKAQFAVISAGMVACMVWDAVNDLLMGIIIENTHFKWGKFKPWILIGALANAAVIICLFTLRPTGWGFVAFYIIGYLCWGMTYTINDISYWGMLPTLSSDAKTRDSLVTLMSIFICIGQFAVAGIVPIVVAGNAVAMYRTVALVVGLAFIAFQALTAFGTIERKREDSAETISLKGMYAMFRRNDQLVIAGIASLLFNIGSNLLIIFGTNFFYMEFGYSTGGDQIFMFTVMYGLGMLFSQALYATINRKFNRAAIMRTAIIVIVIGYLLLFLIGNVPFFPMNSIILDAMGFVIFFFQGLFNLTIIVMINNTIEYDEVRFNERHDSVISAVRSFSVKLAAGINQGVSTLTLIISGIYATSQKISDLEIRVGQGVLSSEEARSLADGFIAEVTRGQKVTLRVFMVLIPALSIGISYLISRFKYKIDETRYDELVNELEKRKGNA